MNRRTTLIWMALVGFILGTSVCPFGDLNGGEIDPHSMKETKAMSTSTKRATIMTEPAAGEFLVPSGMETATFALG